MTALLCVILGQPLCHVIQMSQYFFFFFNSSFLSYMLLLCHADDVARNKFNSLTDFQADFIAKAQQLMCLSNVSKAIMHNLLFMRTMCCQRYVEWKCCFDSLFDNKPRTKERFDNFEYTEHQVEQTPLLDTVVACIKNLDYMHSVYLGNLLSADCHFS